MAMTDVLRQFQSRLVYPDPFKPVGIEFELPTDALVTLKIYDEHGGEISTILEDVFLRAGTHSFEVDKAVLAVPTSLSRLTVKVKGQELTETRKIIPNYPPFQPR